MAERDSLPEFAPLRDYVKDYRILVLVKSKDGLTVRREEMNYGEPKDRVWLGKLSYWGWTNGYTIETSEI